MRLESALLRICGMAITLLLAPNSAQSYGQAHSSAEDQVVYGPALPRSANVWNAPPQVVLTGKIQKLDQQTLEIGDSSGKVRKLPSDRIESIEVTWDTPAAAQAHERFAKRQYLLVLKVNDEVLRAGGFPRWQQCILLAEIVQSCEALDKPELAGKFFLLLTQQSPPDFLLATIPLNWTSRELTPSLDKAARQWLSQSDEYAGLLGASWLLLTDQAESARQRLQTLQRSESKTVQRLAAMQLWRATPPSETSGRMQRWLEARDTLSIPMQLGPSEFLAERFARVDKSSLAVGEWLRIAATYQQHPHRASAALKEAQVRLSRAQDKLQSEHAQNWIQELSVADTP